MEVPSPTECPRSPFAGRPRRGESLILFRNILQARCPREAPRVIGMRGFNDEGPRTGFGSLTFSSGPPPPPPPPPPTPVYLMSDLERRSLMYSSKRLARAAMEEIIPLEVRL